MTSEQKAQAWEWAAKLIEHECYALEGRDELGTVQAHAVDVVAKSLRSIARRIRESSKAKRERGGK